MTNPARNQSDLADTLLLHIRAHRLPLPVREYVALAPRKFRCDLAWPDMKIAIECDGGERLHVHGGGGRHNRAQGMASDAEKQNLLTLAGWKCYRFTGGQVRDGTAIAFLARVLAEGQP